MKALLQKSCKDCTKSSIETYYYTIRGLAKLAGLDAIPTHPRWITEGVLKKVKALKSLVSTKNMALAGLKALRAYGVTGAKLDKWSKVVSDTSESYSKVRSKQERTDREAKNWPKGGYKAISRLADELYQEDAAYILKKAPAKITYAELWRLARWFVILFYSKHALRGDLGDVQIKKKGQNYIVKKGKGWHVHIGNHKTVRAHGAIDLKLDSKVSAALDQYLPYLRAKTNHGYLLSTKRYGNRMLRKDMMALLRNTTHDRLGKRIGVQMIRVMKTTAHLKGIDQAAELRRELAHGPGMQLKYVSRPVGRS